MKSPFRVFAAVASVVAAALCAAVPATGVKTASAAGALPTGAWGFCDSTHTIGCVESVYLTTPAGVTTEYKDATSMASSGAQIAASCTVAGQYSSSATSCDPSFAVGSSGNPCPGYQPVFLMFDVSWPTGVGGSATLVAATGSFEPSLTIGSGTTNIQVAKNDNGTYRYAWTTRIEEHHMSGLNSLQAGGMAAYRAALETAVATSHNFVSHVQVWPRQHLMKSTTETLLYAQPGAATCVEVPFVGAWAEANAESFSWSFRMGTTDISTAARLSFDARAPHFTYPDTNGKSQVYAARIAVYLPRTYLDYIGCAEQCELPASTVDVQTQDGQAATPKISKLGDGFYVNMGIEHYSAPDPVMTLQRVGAPLSRVLTPKSTLETPAVTPRAPAPASSGSVNSVLMLTKSRTNASSVASYAKITVPKGAKVVVKVLASSARVCRVVQSALTALKSGTCRVTVSVTTVKAGKSKTVRRTVSLAAKG